MTYILEDARSLRVEIHPHAERCPSSAPDAASAKFWICDIAGLINYSDAMIDGQSSHI